jgi:hypothetical protein
MTTIGVVYRNNDLQVVIPMGNVVRPIIIEGDNLASLMLRSNHTVSIKDFGAIGDGVTDDTAAANAARTNVQYGAIEMAGRTYAVTSIPSKTNVYFKNGRWKLPDGRIIEADTDLGTIVAESDTGGLETAYAGGNVPVPTVSGRTTKNLRVLIGSQNCRAWFARSGNYTSIYSLAAGNLSANLASRQSNASCPQSVNVGSEECQTGGFGAGNYTAHYSQAVGSRVANLATRYTYATGYIAANVASQDSVAGIGYGLRTKLNFNTDGSLASIVILDGGRGYKPELQSVYFYDRKKSPSRPARITFTTATVNGVAGVVTSFAILDSGLGYTTELDPKGDVYVDLGMQMLSRGFGLVATANVNPVDGGVDSVTIVNGGQLYTTSEAIRILDKRDGVDENGEEIEKVVKAAATFTVDAAGTITSITVTSRGAGYSTNTADTGIDCISKTACQANIASAGCVAEGRQTGNFASHFSTATGSVSATMASNRGATIGTHSAVIAGFFATAGGDYSAVIAGTGTTEAGGMYTANIASDGGCITRGSTSVVIACSGSTRTDAANTRQAAISSTGCIVRGNGSMILAGNICETTNVDQAVLIGRRTINSSARSFVLGDSSSGSASTANRKFQVSATGTVTAAGTVTGSATFTDYAEYFENLQKGVIPIGTLVALDGRKVRPIQAGDVILGVVSATAIVAAGDSPFTWSRRYLTGDFGEILYQDVPMVKWSEVYAGLVDDEQPELLMAGYDGTVEEALQIFGVLPKDAKHYTERHPVENPEYDPTIENVPRSERPNDWSCIGLLGQVYVRVDVSVVVGDYVKAGEGLGTLSNTKTNVRCMEITKVFDAQDGYGIAFCLLR